MSSYLRRAMQDDEKLCYATQLHWVIYLDGLLLVALGALAGHMTPWAAGVLFGEKLSGYIEKPVMYASAAIVLYGALKLVFSFIRQMSTELVITDQRVIAKHGLVATTSYELMMSKVEGATIDQSVLGRMLGYGTLMVKGTGGGISPIDHIADPYRFHTYLMNAIHNAHGDRKQEG